MATLQRLFGELVTATSARSALPSQRRFFLPERPRRYVFVLFLRTGVAATVRRGGRHRRTHVRINRMFTVVGVGPGFKASTPSSARVSGFPMAEAVFAGATEGFCATGAHLGFVARLKPGVRCRAPVNRTVSAALEWTREANRGRGLAIEPLTRRR